MSSTDTKQSAGYFREKAILGLSALTGDDLNKAILKTTSHMLKAPKEKYIQSLLAASYRHCKKPTRNGMSVNEYIVSELEKRSHTHNWIVVLKTMVTYHRLLCDASDDMVEKICMYSQRVFSPMSIKDMHSAVVGRMQKFFIDQYMSYLRERCSIQIRIGYMRRIETSDCEDYFGSLSVEALTSVFEALVDLLAVLSSLRYVDVVVDNYCTLEAHDMLIRDAKRLFHLLSKQVIFVLNGFSDLQLEDKKTWLLLYKRYAAASADLGRLFHVLNASPKQFSESIPRLRPLPESVAERLERDIDFSEMRVDAPCTLESLGISAKEDMPVMDDDEPLPAPTEVPVRTERPVVPTFCMDDLFLPASPPPPQAVSSPPQQYKQSVGAAAPSTDGQAVIPDDAWGSGAPSGWSSGAPVGSDQWGHGAPGGYTQHPPQQSYQQNFTGQTDGEERTHETQQSPLQQSTFPADMSTELRRTQKPDDPFKALFLQSKQQL